MGLNRPFRPRRGQNQAVVHSRYRTFFGEL